MASFKFPAKFDQVYLPFCMSLLESGLTETSNIHEFAAQYFEAKVLERRNSSSQQVWEVEVDREPRIGQGNTINPPDFGHYSSLEMYMDGSDLKASSEGSPILEHVPPHKDLERSREGPSRQVSLQDVDNILEQLMEFSELYPAYINAMTDLLDCLSEQKLSKSSEERSVLLTNSNEARRVSSVPKRNMWRVSVNVCDVQSQTDLSGDLQCSRCDAFPATPFVTSNYVRDVVSTAKHLLQAITAKNEQPGGTSQSINEILELLPENQDPVMAKRLESVFSKIDQCLATSKDSSQGLIKLFDEQIYFNESRAKEIEKKDTSDQAVAHTEFEGIEDGGNDFKNSLVVEADIIIYTSSSDGSSSSEEEKNPSGHYEITIDLEEVPEGVITNLETFLNPVPGNSSAVEQRCLPSSGEIRLATDSLELVKKETDSGSRSRDGERVTNHSNFRSGEEGKGPDARSPSSWDEGKGFNAYGLNDRRSGPSDKQRATNEWSSNSSDAYRGPNTSRTSNKEKGPIVSSFRPSDEVIDLNLSNFSLSNEETGAGTSRGRDMVRRAYKLSPKEMDVGIGQGGGPGIMSSRQSDEERRPSTSQFKRKESEEEQLAKCCSSCEKWEQLHNRKTYSLLTHHRIPHAPDSHRAKRESDGDSKLGLKRNSGCHAVRDHHTEPLSSEINQASSILQRRFRRPSEQCQTQDFRRQFFDHRDTVRPCLHGTNLPRSHLNKCYQSVADREAIISAGDDIEGIAEPTPIAELKHQTSGSGIMSYFQHRNNFCSGIRKWYFAKCLRDAQLRATSS